MFGLSISTAQVFGSFTRPALSISDSMSSPFRSQLASRARLRTFAFLSGYSRRFRPLCRLSGIGASGANGAGDFGFRTAYVFPAATTSARLVRVVPSAAPFRCNPTDPRWTNRPRAMRPEPRSPSPHEIKDAPKHVRRPRRVARCPWADGQSVDCAPAAGSPFVEGKQYAGGAYWGDLVLAPPYPLTGAAAARFTFWAENPLSPRMMSYSTTSPSFSARNPSPAMLLK
jgi:hypothetical protein